MRKPKLHFEQVPIEVVEKIAEAERAEKNETANDNVVVGAPSGETTPSRATRLHGKKRKVQGN